MMIKTYTELVPHQCQSACMQFVNKRNNHDFRQVFESPLENSTPVHMTSQDLNVPSKRVDKAKAFWRNSFDHLLDDLNQRVSSTIAESTLYQHTWFPFPS